MKETHEQYRSNALFWNAQHTSNVLISSSVDPRSEHWEWLSTRMTRLPSHQMIHEREGKEVPTLPSVARSIRNFLQISQEHHETNESTARIIEVEMNMGNFTPAKATAEEDKEDIAYAREQLDLIAEWEMPETKEIILRLLDRLPGIATKAVKLARRRESGTRKGLRELPHAVIKLKPNAKLPRHQAQRLNRTIMKNLENKLRPMEKSGVIQKSSSPCASRALIMLKPGKIDEFRLVIDFRDVNMFVERNTYNIPRISDCLSQLAGGKIFSVIDSSSWFDQITLEEESRYLTAFICALGTYTYAGLPQGLMISPNFAQYIINLVFATGDEFGSFQNVVEYIDDLVIRSVSNEEHERDIERVLIRLHNYRIQVSIKKCHFFVTKFVFLGHQIDAS